MSTAMADSIAIFVHSMSKKAIPNHQTNVKFAPQIYSKSIKNRTCVADAFLYVFGCTQGIPSRSHLPTILYQKSKKWHLNGSPNLSQILQKTSLRRGCVFYVFGCTQGIPIENHLATILYKKRKSGIPKGMRKSIAQKS